MAEENTKVKKGEELLAVLKEILADNSRILENQEEIKTLLRKNIPTESIYTRL